MFVLARGAGRRGRIPWYLAPGWTTGLSSLAWTMANLLDVFSVLVMVQAGGRMVWASGHPAEAFVIYGLLRLLLTLVVLLGAAVSSQRWPWAKRAAWSAVTVCALAAAAGAWWRLYRY